MDKSTESGLSAIKAEPTTPTRKGENEIETARNSVHSTAETITDEASSHDVEAVAQTQSQSEPIYSAFSPGMKKFVIAMATIR